MKIAKTDYVVFILSYGRADRVPTYNLLRNHGYDGRIVIVCDDSDEQLDQYKTSFEDQVEVFSKDDYVGKFDMMDNFGRKDCVVYARNAAYDIAKKLGYDYFIVLDDDYRSFRLMFDKDLKLDRIRPKDITPIFDSYINYLKSAKDIKILSFIQGGDMIGGEKSWFGSGLRVKRKIMNIFFSATDRRVEFIGAINEDVNTYVDQAVTGGIVFSTNHVMLDQGTTQQHAGGLTELYLSIGTYVKSFYSVMRYPSAVSVALMGNHDMRIHHQVNWNAVAPKIIEPKYKKSLYKDTETS